jgi:hypothetical protein
MYLRADGRLYSIDRGRESVRVRRRLEGYLGFVAGMARVEGKMERRDSMRCFILLCSS